MENIIVIISLSAMVFSMFMTAVNWYIYRGTADIIERCLRLIPDAERTAIKNIFDTSNSVINKLLDLGEKQSR